MAEREELAHRIGKAEAEQQLGCTLITAFVPLNCTCCKASARENCGGGPRSGHEARMRKAAGARRNPREPCIPSIKSRKVPFAYNKTLYRQRHKAENLFAKLKDWRRIATRYDRCAHTFFSAICLAANVAFYLNQ